MAPLDVVPDLEERHPQDKLINPPDNCPIGIPLNLARRAEDDVSCADRSNKDDNRCGRIFLQQKQNDRQH